MPDWLEVTLRTLSSMVILFAITKVLGKRQISQLSLFEYITGITLGNLASYVSLDMDSSWYLGVVSLVVWTTVSFGAEIATMRSKRIRDFIDGKGRVLINNGRILSDNLRKEKLTIDEFLEQLRKKDVFKVADVEFAAMESSGQITLMMKREHQTLTPSLLGRSMMSEAVPTTIIMDGQLIKESLEESGYDRDWVMRELRRQAIPLEQVFIGQVTAGGELSIIARQGFHVSHQPPGNYKDKVSAILHRCGEELKLMETYARSDTEKRAYEEASAKVQALIRKP
ncbi:DUF421 domain-containing protein [Paenibacillus sp. GCM10023252]|uniref:DUF421 domain-containing protein n=1 Tax=Paenibacillus sp. GCM10023252 TaxID=3252649 RepID=UPI003610E595